MFSPKNPKYLDLFVRIFAGSIVSIMFVFLLNNYLTFWQGWPGLTTFLANQEWFGFAPLPSPLEESQVVLGWLQLFSYLTAVLLVAVYVVQTHQRSLSADAALLSALATYIIRVAFWMVLLIGMVDTVISFLRVEDFIAPWVSTDLTQAIGRPQFRGSYVHYPLLALSFIIAYFVRSLSFIWLTLMVVVAEFQIVIFRFIFSYEQAFMGDLVRFWYAALFLFASAYTLVHEGHVRVDVFYSQFSKPTQAWANTVGVVLLGLPLCWTILSIGMWDKTSSINSPLHNFEVSQAGYGLYVKYIMVGFLAIYAISMIVQFSSYFLSNVAILREEPKDNSTPEALGH